MVEICIGHSTPIWGPMGSGGLTPPRPPLFDFAGSLCRVDPKYWSPRTAWHPC
ncbi:MAG: hypothetical protein ACI87A_001070 [Planctomycetota bacterium]|jgi:hypothetical protein